MYELLVCVEIRTSAPPTNKGNTPSGFFLEKIFREGKTKFSRNEGGQAKIHKMYVVYTLSTFTSFIMLESDRACPCIN